MPDIGFVKIADPETGKEDWIDTSSSRIRREYAERWKRHDETVSNTFVNCGVDVATVTTGADYIKPLISLFKHR